MQPKYIFEQFYEAELMINITQHFVSRVFVIFIWVAYYILDAVPREIQFGKL
jgi:hypothetical protein